MKEGKKDRAKLALQKKKFQENLISQTEAKILNIEELLNSVEYAKVQQEVFNALKEGNNALQKINSQMSIEEVEKLMDDTAEAIAYQEEISRILGTELTDADNDAVLEELEMIEKGELVDLKTQLPEVKKSPVTLQPAKQVKEKEKEEKEDVIEEEEREVVLA
jgi:charged multivesicular body protein 6